MADTESEMTTEDWVDTFIAQIEKDKAQIRIGYDDLKETYHRGAYRQAGYTKRQCEDRLMRWSGEVLGFELALSRLYEWKAAHNND